MKYGPHELIKLRSDLRDDLEELKSKHKYKEIELIEPIYDGLDDDAGDLIEKLGKMGYGR